MSGNFTTTPAPTPTPTPVQEPGTTTTTTAAAPSIATDKVTTFSKLAVSVLAEVAFMAALGLAYWMQDQEAKMLIVGAVITNATTVVNFWLGSSSGSGMKDALLGQAALPSTTSTTTAK